MEAELALVCKIKILFKKENKVIINKRIKVFSITPRFSKLNLAVVYEQWRNETIIFVI